MLKIIALFYLGALMSPLCGVEGVPDAATVHSEIVQYISTQDVESKLFIDAHQKEVLTYLRASLRKEPAPLGISEMNNVRLIVEIAPRECLDDVIYIVKKGSYYGFQNAAIRMLGNIGDARCLEVLYECLNPNDMRALDALDVLKTFRQTKYDRVLNLLKHKESDYELGKTENGDPMSPGYENVVLKGIEALAWSCDASFIPFLETFITGDGKDIISSNAWDAVEKIKIFNAEDRDKQLRMFLELGVLHVDWIKGVLKREGLELAFRKELDALEKAANQTE